MADLTTIAGIEAELTATLGYDVDSDVALARRRIMALRAKLDKVQEAFRRGELSVDVNVEAIERQLQMCLAWYTANAPQTDAQRLANPSVLHSDFSNFGPYGYRGDDDRSCP